MVRQCLALLRAVAIVVLRPRLALCGRHPPRLICWQGLCAVALKFIAMSTEERTEKFHVESQRPRDKNTPKDIDKLRKYLYKNQNHRFTDKEQINLYQAVQRYVNMYTAEPEPDSPALSLVEDALKMPFTVFTTSQKKSMLKWLEKLNGLEAETADAGAPAAQEYTVLDVATDTAEVMDAEGETQSIDLSVCDPELVGKLRQGFAAEQELVVGLGVRHGKTAIARIVQQ